MKNIYYQTNAAEAIGINVYDHVEDTFIKDDKDNYIIFENMDQAKAWLERNGYNNPTSYEFYISYDNDHIMSYDTIEFLDGVYQFYDYEETGDFIYIEETHNHLIPDCGYLAFGDQENFMEKKEGKHMLNSLNKLIRKCCTIFCNYSDKYYVESSSGIIKVKEKGSTVTLNIMLPYKIMSLNNDRKNNGLNVIPFLKGLDKYKSLFYFITIDNGEQHKRQHIEPMKDVLNCIHQIFNENFDDKYPSCEIRKVELKGSIHIGGYNFDK